MLSLKLLLISLLLIAYLPAFLQENAGIKVALSQKGLNYAAEQAVEILLNKFEKKAWKKITGQKGSLKYSIENIEIKEMTKPLIEATFKEETQSITWLMRNEKVTAGSDWSYKWKKNWLLNFKDSGSVTASVQGVSMMLDLFLKYDVSTKKFIIETTHCQSSIDNIDLDFGGDSSIVYSIITKLTDNPLDRTAEIQMCKAAKKTINGKVNDYLENIELSLEVAKGLDFDVRLMGPPHVSPSHLEFLYSGCLRQSDPTESIACSTNHPSMDNDPSDHMLSISLSGEVFNDILSRAYNKGVMQASITSKDMSDKKKVLFDTKCNSSLCVASFFKKVANKHPNSKFEIDFAVTSPPLLTIKSSQVTSSLEAVATLYVREPDNKRLEVFTTSITTDITLSAKMQSGNVLVSEIVNFNPKFDFVNIANGSTSRKKLEVLGKMLGRILVKKANKAAQRGIRLKNINNMDLKNSDVSVQEGYIRLRSDFAYKF